MEDRELNLCLPCESDGEANPASKYCIECAEPLCNTCVNFHKKVTATKTHKLVECSRERISSSSEAQLLSSYLFCPNHIDKPVEIKCENHNTICCVICAVVNHRNCQTVSEISKIAYGYKSTGQTEKLRNRLEVIKSCIEEIITVNEDYRKELEMSKLEMPKQLEKVKTKFLQLFEKIESFVIERLNTLQSDEDISIGNREETWKLQLNTHISLMKMLDSLLEIGSDSQVYVATHKIKEKLAETEKALANQGGFIIGQRLNLNLKDETRTILETYSIETLVDIETVQNHFQLPKSAANCKSSLEYEAQLSSEVVPDNEDCYAKSDDTSQISVDETQEKDRLQNSSTTSQKPRQDDQKLAYPFPYCKLNSDYGFGQELHCNFSRSLLLIVGTGSVFDREKIVDAAVCSENIDGRGPGYVSKKLSEKGGVRYTYAKATAFKKQPKFGNVVTCKGGNTGFKKVLHTIMWPKDDKIKEEEKRDRFKRMFKAVLKTAVAKKCESIAMPLLFTGQGKVNPEFCTELFLQACFQLSKEEKQAKLTVYLLNTEPWKTDLIVDKIKEFVNFQSALRISKADRLPPPPRSSYPPKKTGRSTQANGNQHVRGGRKPASGMYRSQTELMSNRNRYDKTVHRMSSSFTSMSVRSTQSVFYVDVSDDSRKTQELTKEPNDSDDDSYNSGEDGSDDNQDENCVICMDTVSQPKQLKCGHKFCTDCIDSYFSSYKKVCPTCGAVCGIVTGDQPLGTMDVAYDRNFSCVGYEGMGTIIIRYSFESGKQGPEHPDPGRPYKGITRTAYLPDNKEGRKVCEMLRVAFARRLVFTIGSSRTTGQEGVITWNDIHHKTNLKPHGQFGYPDPGYLDRVKDELAVKGVTPDDIPMLSHTK